LAPDGGLYLPASVERLPPESLRGLSLVETGELIGSALIGDDIPAPALSRILADALNFPVPLVALGDGLHVLELFHGPTFAFKDVGARVMARLMAHVNDVDRPLTILVATSGDTGSAVAQAFFGVPGTRVVVLFPEGTVTAVQEAQFTTLGGNVRALAVAGTFDDCQRLTKEAFNDRSLADAVRLTSANSINIGRLIPQAFYYACAAGQLAGQRVAFSVPSGNVGNLTAGILAWSLGVPIHGFVAGMTINDTFARYLATGRYEPRPSMATLANAMDVGNPSNVERLRALFDNDVAAMRRNLCAVYTDADVKSAIRRVHGECGYVCDPHSAIGFLGTHDARRRDQGVPVDRAPQIP
jgi:threonine synthase